jgi:hypothetical protein
MPPLTRHNTKYPGVFFIDSEGANGDELPNTEKRKEEMEAIEAEKGRWTIARLWDEY